MVDFPAGAVTKVRYAPAVLSRIVAAYIVICNPVVVGAVEDVDTAGQAYTAVIEYAVVMNVDIIVVIISHIGSTGGNSAAETAAVALDDVITDDQVAAVRINVYAAAVFTPGAGDLKPVYLGLERVTKSPRFGNYRQNLPPGDLFYLFGRHQFRPVKVNTGQLIKPLVGIGKEEAAVDNGSRDC